MSNKKTATLRELYQILPRELKRNKKRNPGWPDHPVAQVGMIQKELGELTKLSLEWKYNKPEKGLDQLLLLSRIKSQANVVLIVTLRYAENLNYPISDNDINDYDGE